MVAVASFLRYKVKTTGSVNRACITDLWEQVWTSHSWQRRPEEASPADNYRESAAGRGNSDCQSLEAGVCPGIGAGKVSVGGV